MAVYECSHAGSKQSDCRQKRDDYSKGRLNEDLWGFRWHCENRNWNYSELINSVTARWIPTFFLNNLYQLIDFWHTFYILLFFRCSRILESSASQSLSALLILLAVVFIAGPAIYGVAELWSLTFKMWWCLTPALHWTFGLFKIKFGWSLEDCYDNLLVK